VTEPAIVSSVCSLWATTDDLPTDVTTAIAALDDAEVQALLYVASDTLYALSGRRWRGGGCTRTVTITTDCGGPEQGVVRLQTGAPAARAWTSRLQLPGDWPVTAITTLQDWDLTTIDPDRYRLVNGRELEALDPVSGRPVGWSWPEVTIAYEYGAAPPVGGKNAAVVFASQLLLGRVGAAGCRLPERVKEITRQGVSIAILDPFDFLDHGRTGLVEVDSWLATVNPAKARARPMVWSPDTDRTQVRSHPTGG
jgi:hypothetical protein